MHNAPAGIHSGSPPQLANRVIPLTLGWETVPRSVSLHGDTSGFKITEPVPAVLVETPAGWVLLDTGYNPALVRDPLFAERFYPRGPFPLLPGVADPLEDACRYAGIAFDDIVLVAVSHLHNDHVGGLRHFARRRTPVAIQDAELRFGMQTAHPDLERQGVFRIDFDDPSLCWRIVEGDTDLAPGVSALFTPGHTPGHQSFLVQLDPDAGGGGYAFAFDAADLDENIDREIAPGGLADAERETAVASIRRLKAVAAARGLVTVPGHDPEAWPALITALGGAAPKPPTIPAGPEPPAHPAVIIGQPALVVVDMQQAGYLSAEESGIEQMTGFGERVRRLAGLLQRCRETGLPVIHLQEVHRRTLADLGRELDGKEGVHFVEGDTGTAIVAELAPLPDEIHIIKRRYSGFFGTDLEIALRSLSVSTILLAGELTDVCVLYTFADAHQRDYHVRVIEDCCGGSTIARHEAALDAMAYLQSGARCSTADVLAGLDAQDSSGMVTT